MPGGKSDSHPVLNGEGSSSSLLVSLTAGVCESVLGARREQREQGREGKGG